MEKVQCGSGMGQDFDSKFLGQSSSSGAGKLGLVELSPHIKNRNERCAKWRRGGKCAKHSVRGAAGNRAGTMSEGNVKEPAGKQGAFGNRGTRVDERRHDDRAIYFMNNGVPCFGEIVDTARVANTKDSPITNQHGSVINDA